MNRDHVAWPSERPARLLPRSQQQGFTFSAPGHRIFVEILSTYRRAVYRYHMHLGLVAETLAPTVVRSPVAEAAAPNGCAPPSRTCTSHFKRKRNKHDIHPDSSAHRWRKLGTDQSPHGSWAELASDFQALTESQRLLHSGDEARPPDTQILESG